MARGSFICALLVVVSLSLLFAGTTVKRGTVEAVSEEKQTVTVRFSHSEKGTELKVSGSTTVHLDDKSAELAALKPGMSVTVEVDSDGQAQRILAHTASGQPASTTPRPAKPKTSRKPAKSTKTASKTHSKKKTDDSPFLSEGEGTVVTTPLAGLKIPESKGSARSKGGSWPCFLGPNRDNISLETGLLPQWPPGGPTLAWRTQHLGMGYSSVSISDGMVFSMGTPAGQESLLAIDLERGAPLWSVPTGGGVFQEATGNGPRSTPTIDGSRAYALGASGDLICVDIKSKAVRWRKNLTQDFGAPIPHYGFSESVLIDGPRLICTPGGQSATIAALDKDTGATLWKTQVPGFPGAAYASPIAADTGTTRQYIDMISRGIVGVRARDGQLLWGNNLLGNANVICSTPLFVKDHVFASASYGAGAELLKLTPSEQGAVEANLVYHTREMRSHHGGMVAVGSYVYGADDQALACFSLEQGRAAWRSRAAGKCSITYADRRIYARDENGPVVLVEANPGQYHEISRFEPPKNSNAPSWAYPVVAAGRLFLRDQDDLLCYWLRPDK